MPLSHPCEYGDAFRCSVKSRFTNDRAMRVAAWEASRGALANDGQSRGVGHTRTGAEPCEGW
jgi:hypothetical protein